MAVRCIARQRHISLLSRPLSFHAKQAMIMEEPFTFPVAVAKVFFIMYAVMIVAQHIQVVIRIAILRTLVCTMLPHTRITSIIHQLHVV